MNENYYDILGVSKNASENDIKRAYRKLAVKNHPDKHPGDKTIEEKFKKINEAYATLSDKEKRAAYDNAQASPFGRSTFTASDGRNVDDILNKFFNDGGFNFNEFVHDKQKQSRTVHADDENLNIKIGISISFEEAYTGCKKTISYTIKDACTACDGTGYDKTSKVISCPDCNGRGFNVVNDSLFGFSEKKKIHCKSCKGSGVRREKPCHECGSSGTKTVTKNVSINVPAGISDGTELRAANCGSVGRFGERGDLYIVIHVPQYSSNGVFSRAAGQNMESVVNVSYYELLCGTEKEIRLPDGSVKRYKIPENCRPNAKIKLRGCGFKALKGAQDGDLIIEIALERVNQLTEEQKELLKKFDESLKR